MSGASLISTNTEILLLSIVGLATTLYEITYKDVDEPGEFIWNYDMPEYLEKGQYVVKSVVYGVELVRGFTVHMYIASYLLLYYPLLTEHRRFLLAPWLILAALRSVLLNLIVFLLGIIICVTWDDSITYPCVTFTFYKAAEMGMAMYFFLTVHTFYYDLGRPDSHWPERKTLLLSRLMYSPKVDKENQSCGPDDASLDSNELSVTDFPPTPTRRSAIDRLLAEATLEWFLNEAFGFADVDDEEYERGLSERAQYFLSLTPKEILQQKDKICPHVEELLTQAKLKSSLQYLKQDERPSRDPLARFPYLDVTFEEKPSEAKTEDSDSLFSQDGINCATEEKRLSEEQDNDIKLQELEKRVKNQEVILEERKLEGQKIIADETVQTAELTKSVEQLFDRLQRNITGDEKNKNKKD